MSDAINRFYSSIDGAASLNQTALVELFLYYLTVELGQEDGTPKQVADCFTECDLEVPGNVGARLSEGLKTRPTKYLKTKAGYKLQRHTREAL